MPAARAFGWLRTLGQARRALRALETIADRLGEQNGLLARIADQVAPVPPAVHREQVSHDTGVSHLDSMEVAIADAYTARMRRETGREPSDEELLVYLADEKTHALQERLIAREQELLAQHADRRW